MSEWEAQVKNRKLNESNQLELEHMRKAGVEGSGQTRRELNEFAPRRINTISL